MSELEQSILSLDEAECLCLCKQGGVKESTLLQEQQCSLLTGVPCGALQAVGGSSGTKWEAVLGVYFLACGNLQARGLVVLH